MFQQNILSSFIFGLKIKVFWFAPCRYIVLDMWLVSLPDEIPFTTSFLPVVSQAFCPHPIGLGPIGPLSVLDSSPCFLSHSQVDQPHTLSFQFFSLLLYLNGAVYYKVKWHTLHSEAQFRLMAYLQKSQMLGGPTCWAAFSVSSWFIGTS